MPAKSTRPKPTGKPEKPYEGYPLFSHPSGQWAKKVRKRLHYFGSWRQDPTGAAALETFNREYPYLIEGRTVPPTAVDVSDGCTLRQLVNDFLKAKEGKLNDGELSPRTFRDYYKTCAGLVDQFGRERRVDDLRPDDFRDYRAKLAKRYGVVSLKNEINRVTIVFNYAHANRLIDKPVDYGSHFDRPSAKALRRDRNQAGAKLFERDEVVAILGACDVQLKAMVLLGINCGFGNTDVASLPIKAVDLETGWVSFPRPKTEIPRRIPLWSETIDALRKWLDVRPDAKDQQHAGLMFLTRCGAPWVRVKPKAAKADDEAGDDGETGPQAAVPIDAISPEFGKILRKLKINGRRGIGFYTLRHCLQTYGGEAKDPDAVSAIMGHVDSSMSANYRHRISDERLQAVANVVHDWLYQNSPSPEKEGEGGEA